MAQTYEVEVKSLLGSPEKAGEIREAMRRADPSCVVRATNKQLNHYFENGSLTRLADAAAAYLSPSARTKLAEFAERAREYSVRSRDKDGTVLLVVKASIGDPAINGTSANGVARMEFEEVVPLTLEELDRLILSAGFICQAKWSREREEYLCKGITVTLDKNAGYGWLAEFEKIVDDAARADAARSEIGALMQELGAQELPQDRLERMFAFYNAHWPEYYGTDAIFTVA